MKTNVETMKNSAAFEGTISKMEAQASMEAAKDSAQAAAASVKDGAKAAYNSIKDKSNAAIDSAKEKTQGLRGKVADMIQSGAEKAEAFADSLRN